MIDTLKKDLDQQLEEIFNSPAITVYKDTIYGIGDDWKESLKDATKHLRAEGIDPLDVKDKLSTYAVSPALYEKVKEEGSEALYITKGSRAYTPTEGHTSK